MYICIYIYIYIFSLCKILMYIHKLLDIVVCYINEQIIPKHRLTG